MGDVILAILSIICILLMWAALYDSSRFVTRRLQICDQRIRKPVRAVVISDLHNKRYGKENAFLLAAIRDQKPDFILLAGDILTASPGKSLDPAIHLLRELAKDFPVYYGNGNHEQRLKLYPKTYQDMAARYARALAGMGIEPLANSHVRLEECGMTVYGVEIEKKYYERFQQTPMEEAYLEGLLGKPDKSFYTVLLAHNPEYFPSYARWGADLTLSGHVHGGVARVPFWGKGVLSPRFRLFPKYDGGLFREGEAAMLVSRGLGMHTIPVRLFNPGELWVVDFASERSE